MLPNFHFFVHYFLVCQHTMMEFRESEIIRLFQLKTILWKIQKLTFYNFWWLFILSKKRRNNVCQINIFDNLYLKKPDLCCIPLHTHSIRFFLSPSNLKKYPPKRRIFFSNVYCCFFDKYFSEKNF